MNSITSDKKEKILFEEQTMSTTAYAQHDSHAVFHLYYDEVTNKCYFVFRGKLYPLGIIFPVDRMKAWRRFQEILQVFDLSLLVELYFPKHLSRDIHGRDIKIYVPQMAIDEGTFHLRYKYLMVFDLYEWNFKVDALKILVVPHLYYNDADLEKYIREALLYDNGIVKLFDDLDEYQKFKQELMKR